jgi:3-methylcrotonyl-CoA carboxylase alpha subunit
VLNDEAEASAREAASSADPYSPWHASDQWWLNASQQRVLPFLSDETAFPVRVQRHDSGWQLTISGRDCQASATRASDGRLDMILDGGHERVSVSHLDDAVIVRRDGETYRLRLPDPIAAAAEEDDAGGRLIAPIPGQVTEVIAAAGMAVIRGQILVVLEAMKTVFRLAAPSDGTVAVVSCQAGDSVVEGQLLVSFAEDAEPTPLPGH